VANRLTTDKKLSITKLVGAGLGIAGAGVIIGPSLAAARHRQSSRSSPTLLLLSRPSGSDIKPSVVATGQLTASTILMMQIVFLLYRSRDIVTSSIAIWTAVCVLTVFTTALAFILYFNIIASAGATNASLDPARICGGDAA
jgi:drug/metabolite transporter (DMT)-like permease